MENVLLPLAIISICRVTTPNVKTYISFVNISIN